MATLSSKHGTEEFSQEAQFEHMIVQSLDYLPVGLKPVTGDIQHSNQLKCHDVLRVEYPARHY